LFGRRVLVTRPRKQAAEHAQRHSALGAHPVEAPVIRVAPVEDGRPLAEAVAAVHTFDWIVFTSVNAVDAFMKALYESGRDVRMLKGPRLCTVGPGTAEQLAQHCIKVDLVPADFRAEGVVSAITAAGAVAGTRVLLPHADIGRELIADQLRDAGALVTDVVAYRTVLEDPRDDDDPDVYRLLLEGSIDVVTFASPSAVRAFSTIYGEEQAADLLKNTVVAVIGPTTAEAARQLGINVTIQPAAATIPALVDAIENYYTKNSSSKF
jgi:uroporphyrinogen III methyltransferase/synthase